MKPCPRCGSVETWQLGDGRFKCRACGTRYSWKSAWDSVRLPDASKERLLEAFVQGMSVYQQRHDNGACVDSRERFYRMLRAACKLRARVSADALCIASVSTHERSRSRMRGWATAGTVMIIGIIEENGEVRISPIPHATMIDVLPVLRERTAIGGVYCVQENHGFANLRVQGDHVIVRRGGRAPLGMNSIETFWDFARERLQSFRRIHCKFMHLYLAEMCFRFNHRDANLAELLRASLRSTSGSELRALLRGATVYSRSENVGSCSSFLPGTRLRVLE